MRRCAIATVVVVLCVSLAFAGATAKTKGKAKGKPAATDSGLLPITTSSAEALKTFQDAEAKHENLYLDDALAGFRTATHLDRQFAMAYAMLSYLTKDPVEEAAARSKAKALEANVTPGEKLVIHWIVGVRENQFVPAIAAMNDALAKYPTDPHLAFMAGRWLGLRLQFAPSERILERAAAAHPDFAPIWNELAYAYADDRQFDKALDAVKKYAGLLPNEVNPQDTWGEIARMAGKYDESIEHYQAALKMNPKFFNSQYGLAGAYALMGQEEKAREEYAKGVEIDRSEGDRIDFLMQAAATYMRENKPEEAIKAFEAVATRAHKASDSVRESEAFRQMAFADTDAGARGKHLGEAEAVLTEHETAKSDADEQLARVLFSRVYLSVGADAASQQLQKLASSSESSVVATMAQGANGVVLFRAGKDADAVADLQDQAHNKLALLVLAQAYMNTDKAQAKELLTVLSGWSEPLPEQAIVTPEAKKLLAASATAGSK